MQCFTEGPLRQKGRWPSHLAQGNPFWFHRRFAIGKLRGQGFADTTKSKT